MNQKSHRAVPVYDSTLRPHPFVEELQELLRYRDLLWQWSMRNLKLRYKRSVLGILWTLLEPLMMMTILSIVFTAIFRFSIENYPIYVLSGLLLFDFFGRSTTQMIEEIMTSQHLTKRVYAPSSAFALAAVITYLVNWLLALIPLFAIMIIMDVPFSWSIAALPIGIVLTAFFAIGIGLIIATVGAFFHDVKLIYQVIMTAWFYATPIIYPIEIIPDRWRGLFLLNPVYHLCSLVREPVFGGRLASPETWFFAAVSSLTAALVGWWVFTHWRDSFGYL